MNKAQRDIRRKTRILEHAARIGNVRKTYRYFGVARSGFYVWEKAYETHGDEGLVNQDERRTGRPALADGALFGLTSATRVPIGSGGHCPGYQSSTRTLIGSPRTASRNSSRFDPR